MKKEKTVKQYTRKSKTGKNVTVKQHTAKYDSAEDIAKEALKRKNDAGAELESRKKKVKVAKPVDAPESMEDKYGFSPDDFKSWYHWDVDADPKNKQAKKVEKALKSQMGTKAYNKYFYEMSDNYSARGHNKAFKGLSEKFSAGENKKSVTPSKETKSTKIPSSAVKVKTSEGDLYVSGTTLRTAKIYKETPSGIEKLHPKRGFSEKDAKKIEKAISKRSNKYGGMTKEEFEKRQRDFAKRVKDADKGTRAKYSFTDIKKKIKGADISDAARKRLLKSINKPYAVVTPAVMEKRLQKELDKSSSKEKKKANPFNGRKREELEAQRERYMQMMRKSPKSERKSFMQVIDNIDEALKRKK